MSSLVRLKLLFAASPWLFEQNFEERQGGVVPRSRVGSVVPLRGRLSSGEIALARWGDELFSMSDCGASPVEAIRTLDGMNLLCVASAMLGYPVVQGSLR